MKGISEHRSVFRPIRVSIAFCMKDDRKRFKTHVYDEKLLKAISCNNELSIPVGRILVWNNGSHYYIGLGEKSRISFTSRPGDPSCMSRPTNCLLVAVLCAPPACLHTRTQDGWPNLLILRAVKYYTTGLGLYNNKLRGTFVRSSFKSSLHTSRGQRRRRFRRGA